MQGLCREGNVPAVALAGPLHPVTVPGPAVSAAVALPVRERWTYGTPKRRHRRWRNRSSCTWAFAVGTDWTTTPEVGHEDVGSEEFVVLMLAAPYIPRSVRECRIRSAVRAMSIARVLATMRVIVSLVSG